MQQHQHLGVVDPAQRNAAKIADAKIDGHPHALDGTAEHDTLAMKFDTAHAVIGADIVRIEADRNRERVEPQCAARPGGIDPACCCLTPHDFNLPARLMCPVDG